MTRRIVFAAVAAVVGAFYFWLPQAGAEPYYWGYDLSGYYNFLAQGLARGQLHLPVEPAPELLALPDPWDYRVGQEYKPRTDLVLFNKRYYLYHGAAPAVLLFTPWRLVTGHDVAESFAVFLFCFGGFLFSARALLRLLELAEASPGPLFLSVLLVALGFCQCAPFLLNRTLVYEVAIACGYFCIAGGVHYLTMSIGSARWASRLFWSGLMFGLAVGCRPHLGLAGVIAAIGLAWSGRDWRRLLAFAAPLLLVWLGVAGYNYARFGDPLEFGNRFLLAAGPNQQAIKLAFRNMLPGLYYLLLCRPELTAVFPWLRAALRPPFDSAGLPYPGFVEPVAGALYLAPFVLAVFVPPVRRVADRGVRMVLVVVLASAAASLAFLTATGLVAQRYVVDFLPLAVLAVSVNLGIWLARATGWKRVLGGTGLAILVAFGVVANLAIGIAGPYDGILHDRPAEYVRIAGWFSPIARFRLALNPRTDLELDVRFSRQPEGFREPLAVIGGAAHRYFLFVEHHGGKLRLVSKADTSMAEHAMEHPGETPVRVRMTYDPASRRVSVAVNGNQVLAHEVPLLVLAPSQVTIGAAHPDLPGTPLRFTGRINVLRETIGPSESR